MRWFGVARTTEESVAREDLAPSEAAASISPSGDVVDDLPSAAMGRRWITATARSLLFAAAVIGLLAGLWVTALHIQHDPLADVAAYYDAGDRLNRGLPLYVQTAATNTSQYYFYPPLLAIAFRPLALLPYPMAAAVWEGLLVVVLVGTIRILGVNRTTALAIALLALPIGWALSIGQAQVLVTFLLAIGSPWAVALAAHLKVFPALVAVYWLGRRDWPALRRFVLWTAALGLVQLVLEPAGTVAFLSFPSFELVGEINNLSPYALSPQIWAVFVAALVAVALLSARSRVGWAAAVSLSVFASPRLFSYMLMSLLAALRPTLAATTARHDGSVSRAGRR